MNYLLLTRDSLDIGSITDLVSSDICGATSLFVGTPREELSEYGASESMAEKEMENICGELRFRWSDIVNIVIYHRIGLVPVGEANVVIAISSPNGNSSLNAVAVVIEELKKRVPIWRKERYEGDSMGLSADTLKFDENLCDIQDSYPLPSKFVQISASETEIVRRIASFIERKREEIDLNNIVDYINPRLDEVKTENYEDSLTTSCARINGTIIKQENSKCHLKVRQMDNKMGPQVQHDYLYALDNLMETQIEQKIKQENSHEHIRATTRSALLQRARDIEEHLSIQDNNKKNIHQRLKYLEDRILLLESISPEYHNNLFDKPHFNNSIPALESYSGTGHTPSKTCHRRKIYAVGDINHIIENEIERN